MISPEKIRSAPTPTRNRRRFAPLVLATGVAITSGSMSMPQETFPHPISNPDQPVFAYYYGTLPLSHPGTMIESTNIADNYLPFGGRNAEYDERDVQEAFRQLQELRNAGVDGITISWHSIGDSRDKGISFLINNVLPRCDNPFPGIKVKIIFESLANLNVDNSDTKLDQKMEHLWETVLNSPFYYKNKDDGLPEIDFFTGDNPIWWDGIPVDKTLVRLGIDFGIHPVLRDYEGSVLDDTFGLHPDAQKLDKFSYGFPFYKLHPRGLAITPHQATITPSYHKVTKRERDYKSIDYDPYVVTQNIRRARSSNAEILGIVSYNEGVEDTDFEGDPAKITLLGRELYDPQDQATRDVFPVDCKPAPQNTVIVKFPQPIPYPYRKAS